MKYEKLNELGLNLTLSQQNLLDNFAQAFLEINSKINLISKGDSALLFEKHIYDSLAFNLFYKKYDIKKAELMDIGTGGGFPALPISLIYKDINVTAVDSINKKINSVKYIKDVLKIDNLTPVCIRAEDLKVKNKFDIVTSRAMAELRIMIEYAIPFLKTGGYFAAYKSIKAEEEIKNAQNALNVLNAEIVDKIEYSLPIPQENNRVLLIIVKKGNVSDIYPRKNGNISKCPL